MGRYLIRRILQFIPVFFIATFAIFYMVYALPGDPIRALAGERAQRPSVREELRDRYNLDDPVVVQYGKYVNGLLLHGDLGDEFSGRPVRDKLERAIPHTLRMTAVAFAFEAVLGIGAGILAGIRKKGFFDSLVLVTTLVVIAIPIVVLAFLAQLFFGLKLGWFPISGALEGWRSYLLPGMVLGSLSLAYIARLTRTSLVENLRADYVRTARAKGLPPRRVIGVHALRNSLIPVITFLGADLGALMGGAIVTETVFNIPGVGRTVYDGIIQQEGALVVGVVTFIVIVYLLANLLVDVLYAVLDPRIRYD